MKTWKRIVWSVLGITLGAGALLHGQASAPAGPGTPPATCEARVLDLQEELVKTQDALAQWQSRAIRAEAQLALDEIAKQREKLKTPAPPPTGGAPK